MPVKEINVPGEHNLLNALAALAIVADLVPDDVATEVLRTFSGVPHRLELVDEVEGVRFINDSIATTPERTLAGLRATEGPIVLMLGGRDKNLPLDPLRDELKRRVRTRRPLRRRRPAMDCMAHELRHRSPRAPARLSRRSTEQRAAPAPVRPS